MAERTSMMLEPTPAVAMTLPAEVREKLAELELELSEGGFIRLLKSLARTLVVLSLDHRPLCSLLCGAC